MKHMDRTSSEDNKDGQEWNRIFELQQQERQKQLALQAQVVSLLAENQRLKLEVIASAKNPQLEAERDSLKTQVQDLESQLKKIQALGDVHSQLDQTQKKLERVQKRVYREDFWRGMVSGFAESIDSFPMIYGAEEQDTDAKTLSAISDWNIEIELILQMALQGQAESEDLERARRLLIAQWVLLRWLEVAEVVG